MTIADLVEQAMRAGLDANQIAHLVAVHAPELAARMESTMQQIAEEDIQIGQSVVVGRKRYTVAAVPRPGDWEDGVILVPEGTQLVRAAADLLIPSTGSEPVLELRSL